MLPIFRIIILFFFFFLFPQFAWTDELVDALQSVQAKLDTLTGGEETAQKKRLKEIYLDSRQILVDHQEYLAKAALYTQQIKDYPKQLKSKEGLKTKTKPLDVRNLSRLSLDEMEQRHIIAKAKLLELQSQQQKLTSDIETLRRRSNTVRDELVQINNAFNDLSIKPVPITELDDNKIIEAVKKRREYRREALIANIQMLELELLVLPKKLDIALLENQMLTPQIQALTQEIDWLAENINIRRKTESEQAIEKSRRLTTTGEWGHPALLALAKSNEELAIRLNKYTEQINGISAQRARADSQLNLVTRSYSTLQQRLELQGRDEYLGTEIRKQLRQLPAKVNIKETQSLLNDARLEALNLEKDKLDLMDSDNYLDQMLKDYAIKDVSPPFQPMSEAFYDLRNSRLQVIDQSLVALYAYIKELELYYSVQNQLNAKINQFDILLRENLLLTLSARPLDMQLFDDIQRSITWLISEDTRRSLYRAFAAGWLKISAIAMLFIPVWWIFQRVYWPRYKHWEQHGKTAWGKVNQDKAHYPLGMLLIVLLQSLLVFLPLHLIHLVFQYDSPNEMVRSLSFTFHVASLAGFIWCFLLQLCRPKGLLITQFKWPEVLINKMYKEVKRYAVPVFLLSTFIAFCDSLTDDTLRNSLGRLAFIAVCILFAIFAWSWMAVTRKGKKLYQDQSIKMLHHPKLWMTIIFAEQLYMITMAAMGYYFATLYQKILVIQSLLWMLMCALIFSMSYRALLIAQRRIAFRRAIAKRGEMRAQRSAPTSKGEGEIIDDTYVDIKTISKQSETLLRISVWVLVIMGLGMIWINVLPALGFLEKIVFWSTSVVVDGETEVRLITLKTLLISLLILGLVIIATQNLPGALELLILRHLNLDTGTSYAITTLLKYSVILIGIMVTFQQLGMEWSKLQWLIAALSVGLGFGLQEIVANFVSGLIILFERPIRIGDTITLNDVSGTVSRIHIRATTLIDFNRKEIVVPNKTFITERLTNWSLTDQITRIQIPIGIAYGSDCDKARTILLEIARNHPQVLADPEPVALFLEFGDSALNFELRVYVDSIGNRLPVTNELNMQIHRRFADEGIVIAFPQLDVHWYSEAAENKKP
ncbi:MAG: mechanosensitive ion channel domain-containing protein [Gammaproteobacteria bacterium]